MKTSPRLPQQVFERATSSSAQRRLGVMTVWLCLAALCLVGCGSNRVERARTLFERGATEEGKALLAEELRDNPANSQAHYVRVLYEEKDDGAARALLLKLTKQDTQVLNLALDDLESYVTHMPEPAPRTYSEDDFLRSDPGEGAPWAEDTTNYPVARFAVVLVPEYIKARPDKLNDESKAYCLLHRLSGGADTRRFDDQFIAKFPKSPRSLSILWDRAVAAYVTDRPQAKTILKQIAKDFASSDAAKTAKKLLGDWWSVRPFRITLNDDWQQVCHLEDGQKYRFVSMDAVKFDMGALGVDTIDIQKLEAYQGSSLSQALETYRKAHYVQYEWSGGSVPDGNGFRRSNTLDTVYTATSSGDLWVRIPTGSRRFERELLLVVETKDLD